MNSFAWQIAGVLHDDSWRCPAGHSVNYDETVCRRCAQPDAVAAMLAVGGDDLVVEIEESDLYVDRSVDL